MASVRSTIDLIITGATRGLGAAAAEADAMARRVADAEDRVSAARTRSAAAEERVGVAEQRLQSARQGQEAALSRIGVAETNLERVRANSNESTTRLARAQEELDRVRNTGGASAERIAQAEAHVNQVRQESDLASRRTQQAEAQLATARANGERASSRVTAAEAALARARSDNIRASEASARADNDLNNLRRRGNRDVEDQRSGLLGLFDAFSRLGNAISGADDASNKFLATGAALGNLFSTILGPIGQVLVLILAVTVGLVAWGEVIGVVGGAIGQALGGAIPVLLALGAAAGTVLLGMDGIKKAAEAAAPAFDKLKQAVSAEFLTQLTPVFKQLAKDIPLLTENFRDIARAVSDIAQRLVGVISSTAGMQRLQLVLAGTADFVLALGPGIQKFADGLIRVGAAAAPAMQQLGAAIGGILGQIGDVFTRLAGDGTIQKLVVGLAATLKGLGDVVAPVVDILLRMGAALGTTVGSALTELGKIIGDTTPFFEHLAFVAGDLLKSAFEQLGPPIERLFGGTIPDANAAMDAFASFIKGTVLPALASFIDWIRTDGIPGFKAFAEGIVISATEAASAILGFVSAALGALEEFALFLFKQTGDNKFLELAGAAEVAKRQVDGLKGSVDQLHDKTVKVLAQGALESGIQVQGLNSSILLLHDRTVASVSNVPGGPTTGTEGNQRLNSAILLLHDRTVASVSNVPGGPTTGTEGNKNLKAAIDALKDKTVTARANVVGEAAVRALQATINAVHDKTVTVTTVVRNIVRAFATGGDAPGGVPILVGERGPEIVTLPRSGGMITNAERSRSMISSAAGGGGGPITVQVNLSQDTIAGIAEVVIQRRDRATRRTVTAGSGVTF